MNESPLPHRDLAIFTAALALPATQRAAFLERECGDDVALRHRVEALLQAHEQAGDFMEQPPLPNPAHASPGESTLEKPGDRIGRYKLLQQIGEGGCGVVYMAEQEEPVRRRVALKIIKAGMDTKSVIARFEAERQALAMMDHPNIAKVLDAGATESGRPYFVMELVRGVKISDYCDEHSLTMEDRLRLFVQVCEAVQHAHQKGIIHRDIKPSNILVRTTEAGVPSPVVIDFGIAKATTNQWLTDKTLFTAFEMLIGTPAYMSPEQAVLGSVDVDTRTDIYSLGVLLYELLTSVTPFDAGELLKAGLDEIRRVINEREPVRPSSRLSKMTKDDLTTVAHHRKAEPPRLIRAVHGDLDWIVMKALEKDRTRRYATANGLALDITRYLTNETISARPPSPLYRFQKTVARHKVLFAGLAFVTALLLVSLVMISSSLTKEREARMETDSALQRADAARKQAEANAIKASAEAAKSQQITKFLEELLLNAGPLAAQGRDTKLLREILDRAATRIDTKLADQPAVQAELKKKIGAVYTQLAVYDRAEVLLQAALITDRKLFGNGSTEVADALERLGSLYFSRGDIAGAEKAYGEELELRRNLPGGGNPLELARCLKGRAGVYYRQKKFAEAEALVRESLALRQKAAGKESLEAADSLNGLAALLGAQGKLAEEEVMERDIYTLRLKRLGPDHGQTVGGAMALAETLSDEGKLDEAEATLREVLPHARKVFGEAHEQVARGLMALGSVLNRKDQEKDAEPLYREALVILRKITPDDLNEMNGEGLRGLGRALRGQAKLAEAESVSRHALEVARKKLGGEETASALDGLVRVLREEKKPEAADQIVAEVIPPGFVPTRQNADLLKFRANYLGQHGQWNAAGADLGLVLEYRPTDFSVYKMSAAVRVALGDSAALQQLSGVILKKFGDSTTATTLDPMATSVLVLPDTGLDLKTIGQALTRGNHAGLPGPALHRHEGAEALWEYRSGHFSSAAEWAEKWTHSHSIEMQTSAYAVLAMAQFQLKQFDAAKKAWTEGDDRTKQLPVESGNSDLGEHWEDGAFARALMTEATAMTQAPDLGGKKP